MQWVWRPFFDHLGKSSQIFTYNLYDHYCWPGDFDDDPVIDDESLESFNAWDKVEEMFNIVIH